jgi:hypothetical protein
MIKSPQLPQLPQSSQFSTNQTQSQFSSVNTRTNIFGYFCRKGNIDRIESKFKRILLKRRLKKSSIDINRCINRFLVTTCPYVKAKVKKRPGRRSSPKKRKALLVYPIERIKSKQKRYLNFSNHIKSLKKKSISFISQLESELESFTLNKQKATTLRKHVLEQKLNLFHKSAYKYVPHA